MNTNRTIVVLVAVLVVGGVPSALAAAGGPSAVTPSDGGLTQGDAVYTQDNETTTVGTNQTTEEENVTNVTFADQTSNGSAVVVDGISIGETKPPGGFAVIHLTENETDAATNETANVTEEMLGERIGNSTFLESGEHENVTVELNRTLEESQTLVAVAYQDSQSDEQFDPEGDQPFETEDGLVADAATVNVSDAGDTDEAE